MSVILLENDKRIKNLFNIMFSSIDLNSPNSIIDNNKTIHENIYSFFSKLYPNIAKKIDNVILKD